MFTLISTSKPSQYPSFYHTPSNLRRVLKANQSLTAVSTLTACGSNVNITVSESNRQSAAALSFACSGDSSFYSSAVSCDISYITSQPSFTVYGMPNYCSCYQTGKESIVQINFSLFLCTEKYSIAYVEWHLQWILWLSIL